MSLASVAAFFLMVLGGKSSGVLWGFTALLGLSFATINGATVSWAAQHLPGELIMMILTRHAFITQKNVENDIFLSKSFNFDSF